MILSTYEQDNKSANVCLQQHQWAVMIYENNQYIKTIYAHSETKAEEIAEDYVMGVK